MSPGVREGVAQIEGWHAEFERLHERLRSYAAQGRTHVRMKLHLEGVLGKAERKNGWHLAEAAGDASPYAMQHLLGRASWDVVGVREETRRYVREGLGSGILARIVDESGFLKKGKKSAGVARQYSGTAGRVENCQIGVFLAYGTRSGCAYVDARLYLPESWTEDRARCREAGIPDEIGFQTKPQLALQMLKQAHAVDGPVPWVLGDEVYGRSEELRQWLEEQKQSYVLAVPSNVGVRLPGRKPRHARRVDRVDAVVAELPDEAWQCLSAGAGSKGPRLYDWALIAVESSDLPDGWKRFLLARRSLDDTKETACYFVLAPAALTLQQAIEAAGLRWSIESGFEQAKQEVGLDEYEVRQWEGWNRYITLGLLAHAFLAVQRARSHAEKGAPNPPLTRGPPPERKMN
jgi:SRSO17 transposase